MMLNLATLDWQAMSTKLTVDGQMCGSNQICQELATYGINANQKIQSEIVNNWVKTGTDGQWCSNNKTCVQAVQKALETANVQETKAIAEWMHPTTVTTALPLMNLNIWDDIKNDVHKAETAVSGLYTKVKNEVQVIGGKVMVAGQWCGSHPICLQIAQKGTQILENGETSLVMNWINTNQKASWCKNNSLCMNIVQKAL